MATGEQLLMVQLGIPQMEDLQFAVIICISDYNDMACEMLLEVWLFPSVRSLGVLLSIKWIDFL